MRSSQEDIALLDEYLKGRLSLEDTAALNERLKVEPDLSEDLQDIRIIQEVFRISELKSKLDMLRDLEKGYETKSDKINSESIKSKAERYSRLWLIIGLVFISMILGWWYFQKSSETQSSSEYASVFAEHFNEEFILHKTMRSAVQSDELSLAQRRAYELYSIQLFDDAIPLLDELWVSQKDTLALFYLGVSHLGIGDKKKGLEILQKPELIKYSEQINYFINH